MKNKYITPNNLLLLLIIVVSAILRFYHFSEIPFTHDEFSALFRTYFDSFGELIEKGVKVDGHPAGIQIFLYYWTKTFGYTEWVVKLPFALMGVLSVWLIYLIGKEWYNKTVALISAAFLATLQFSVIYSQIARPYISGLFFSLLLVYFWSKVIRHPQHKYNVIHQIGYVLSAALCAYNHHFSLLFAFLVVVSGVFYLPRKYLIKYGLISFCIALLYIPHLKILFYQLSVGGLVWLGEPSNDFILQYLYYIFNYSMWCVAIALIISIAGYLQLRSGYFNKKNFPLFFTWFLLPFLIGFFYSKYGKPVLQYSVLIFSFPFLFFVLFGHLKEQKVLVNLVLVVVILLGNSLVLVYGRKHYQIFYSSVFESFLNDIELVQKKNPNVAAILDSHDRITNYYLTNDSLDIEFKWYNSFESEKDFLAFLEEYSEDNDTLFCGLGSANNPVTVNLIKDYFPYAIWKKDYVGGSSYLFTKGVIKNAVKNSFIDDNSNSYWTGIKQDKFQHKDSISKRSYILDSVDVWSPTFSVDLFDFVMHDNDFVDVQVNLKPEQMDNELLLVTELNANGKNIYWNSVPMQKYYNPMDTTNSVKMYQSMKLSDIKLNYSGIQLKVYLWNKGKQKLQIESFGVSEREGNPYIYGLTEKIIKSK